MSLLDTIIIAVIQGLAEFLPVSSSGHMVLAKDILNVHTPGATLEVALHLGTLTAVCLVFWKDLRQLISGFTGATIQLAKGTPLAQLWKENTDWRMGWFIIIGSVPAGILGVFVFPHVEALFSSAALSAIMLFVTGEILWLTRPHSTFPPKGNLRLSDGIIIGLGQAFAILPGVSRSGTTISIALFRGVDKSQAARFSFLLSIPAIMGAALLQTPEFLNNQSLNIPNLICGGIVAAIVGTVALKMLLSILQRGKMHWFAYYCWGAAILGGALSLAKATG
jgi:undecaprenyl-diphosphatase